MKRLLLPLFALVLLCTSCGNDTIFDESHSFDNDTWLRFEPEVFSVPVTNNDKPYCLTVSLRYDTSRFLDPKLPLVVDFFQDSNELHNFTPTIRLRNRNGKLRGECIDRYCTVTDTIDRFRMYNKPGTYTYRIKQRTSKYEIGGIASIALKVEQVVK
ncbi:MAG: hypothetical protein IKN84_04210 [Bacteroidales bacterium]|jgi:gliding motility-associated lipoprotein GldH|nr:hypothetical protein [Bacteroidales bacterium]